MARGSGRTVTLRDIAAELGVSVSAVSLALRERPGVGDELRRTVLDAAERMGYVADRSAVTLRTGRSGVVGLLIRNLRNPFFLDVVDGFDRECAEQGYHALITSSRYDAEHERDLLEALTGRGVDGLAMAPIGSGRAVARWSEQTGKPAVVINCSRRLTREVSAVRVDAAHAVRVGVAHLLELGHRRIGLLAAPAGTAPDPEREVAFAACAEADGFDPVVLRTALSESSAAETMSEHLGLPAHRRVTGILTNSDFTAYGLYRAARSAAVRIPEDLSIVGHDDLPTSALVDPPLTTFAVDRVGIGAHAARAVISRVVDPGVGVTRVLSAGRLVIRGSTGPAPA